jgi:hypothetical protein
VGGAEVEGFDKDGADAEGTDKESADVAEEAKAAADGPQEDDDSARDKNAQGGAGGGSPVATQARAETAADFSPDRGHARDVEGEHADGENERRRAEADGDVKKADDGKHHDVGDQAGGEAERGAALEHVLHFTGPARAEGGYRGGAGDKEAEEEKANERTPDETKWTAPIAALLTAGGVCGGIEQREDADGGGVGQFEAGAAQDVAADFCAGALFHRTGEDTDVPANRGAAADLDVAGHGGDGAADATVKLDVAAPGGNAAADFAPCFEFDIAAVDVEVAFDAAALLDFHVAGVDIDVTDDDLTLFHFEVAVKDLAVLLGDGPRWRLVCGGGRDCRDGLDLGSACAGLCAGGEGEEKG